MRNNNFKTRNQNTPAIAGIILLIIGFIWLLGEMNIHLPNWLMQPYSFLIGIGIYLGAKRNFQSPFGWMIPLGIGACWFVSDMFDVNIWRFGFPVALIGAGIYIIINGFGKKKDLHLTNNDNQLPINNDIQILDNSNPNVDDTMQNNTNEFGTTEPKIETTNNYDATANEQYNDDVMDTTAIFSSTQKMITSKKFRGGDIVAIMGGVDINLSFADMETPAVLDVSVLMGGLKIIVPAGWEVKNNITSILGGVEMRRPPVLHTNDKKLLVLKGTVIMGGIDVRNY